MNHLWDYHERQDMTDIQRRTPNIIATFDDVNIQHNRAGHADRERTVRQIKDSEESGYITAQEASARITHAVKAETSNVLHALTDDLPAPIDHRGYFQAWDFGEPKYFLPVLISTMIVSLCSAIIPGVILGAVHELSTTMGQAIFTPLLIIGVIGAITSLTLIVIKSS